MNTEEKNALAKEYAIKKYPLNAPGLNEILQEIRQKQCQPHYKAALDACDAEVENLVSLIKYLVSVAKDDGTSRYEFVMNECHSLLSKYPVNKEGNG